ncbi:hypothetical protein CDV55_104846 [Aspergillus turcosus]|nr:hypothetical protein CDV55_104846 [Aspergillus turcosus]
MQKRKRTASNGSRRPESESPTVLTMSTTTSSNSSVRTPLDNTDFLSAELKMSSGELGWSFADTERNPQDLVANGFRPVWTIEEGYPGPLPDDIAKWIDPEGDNRTIRLVGPMSSIFWLGRLDDLFRAIDSPDFTVQDEIICIPDNASIRSMLQLLFEDGKIPGAVYRNYCDPPPDFSLVAFPLRNFTIPPSVTGSVASHRLRDLFPFCRQQRFPQQVLSARVTQKKHTRLCQELELVFTSSLGGNLLFRGLSRSALNSAMAWFLPTVNSSHADNEFGPGIYTTPSLERALRYTGAQGALMVFQNPDFQRLNVWEPSSDEWAVIITYWTGRILSNAQARVPASWDTDVIRGAISQSGEGRGAIRIPGPDTQVVAVSNAGLSALAASLKMIIWLE